MRQAGGAGRTRGLAHPINFNPARGGRKGGMPKHLFPYIRCQLTCQAGASQPSAAAPITTRKASVLPSERTQQQAGILGPCHSHGHIRLFLFFKEAALSRCLCEAILHPTFMMLPCFNAIAAHPPHPLQSSADSNSHPAGPGATWNIYRFLRPRVMKVKYCLCST